VAEHPPYPVEVITPEGVAFAGNAEILVVPGAAGDLGILEPTELRLYRSESDIERFAQGEGYIQVGPEGVLVLVEEAMNPDQLNASDLQERLRRAEEAAEQAEDGTEEQRRAVRDKKRWKAFLDIAGG